MLHREIVGLPTTVYPVDEWALVECGTDPEYLARAETIFSLSNGYVGLRGAPDEGRPQHDLGTFVNGFHETWPIKHAEEAFGFARTGQTIVAVPDARRFHLYVDDEPLQVVTADIESYERRLDMRTGELVRDLVWRTPSGKRVRVRSRRLVSMAQRHLVAFRYEVTMLNGSAPVVISSQLRHEAATDDSGRMVGDVFDPSTDVEVVGTDVEAIVDPRRAEALGDVLVCEGHGVDGRRGVLRYRVADSGMTLACGIDHHLSASVAIDEESFSDRARAKTVFSGDLGRGESLVLEKFGAYVTSHSAPSKRLADRVHRVLDRAMDRGYDDLAREQAAWYDEFWAAADVVIEDNPVVQQAVRWSLFQIVQAAARAEGTGIPAKGLTGSGYEGHYFWDTEIYVLPFLTYTLPRAARNLLRFRYTLLDAARRRAREVNQEGALFPWRTINGEEASAYYEAGTAQYHINADIVYAIRKYVRATDDHEFLMDEGAEILVETARLWVDLGFFRNGDRESFHIHGVTGPDEYTTVVNDNAYTNLMARLNLDYAAEVVDLLREERPDLFARLSHRTGLRPGEVQTWRRAAEAMHVPHDDRLGITPQDVHFLEKEVWDFAATPREKYPLLLHFHPLVIYRHQVLKQADIVLAMFLLPGEFDPELKRANFDHYDPLTTGDSSLSASVQSVVAAELGDDARALEYFRFGLFVDLADVAGNVADGVHVAAAGGVWQSLVYGFAGFRDDGDVLAFNPRLPSNWRRMSFAITTQAGRVRVAIGRLEVTYTLEVGDRMTIRHRHEVVELVPDEPAVRDLTAGAPDAPS
ncbi:glycoside hydrolase family 65 protein [Salsipaludibacter albus]|uniref:glycoside hydrolase family 65 protein n=1 Tax=Salsipaludibacter albus TaxID=2849650 RepID=UPI001EE429F5|nr:glycosyl hydrolase family 65 protein [Salsipaludibacter albus]MBY5162440.1 glycoside hydrolase family 65 protein [Salsipaludibacter albus]